MYKHSDGAIESTWPQLCKEQINYYQADKIYLWCHSSCLSLDSAIQLLCYGVKRMICEKLTSSIQYSIEKEVAETGKTKYRQC